MGTEIRIDSFIYSFRNYFLRIYYVPGMLWQRHSNAENRHDAFTHRALIDLDLYF